MLMADVSDVNEQVLWELDMTADYADSTWHKARVLVRVSLMIIIIATSIRGFTHLLINLTIQ